ncbi:MAG TPA: cytochrome c [Nitrospinota bacterium]|jgi:mono/diheme cytochrome c family protein|nr:cytochrome c [Nitrospinota bacterium]|tara:strand:- start:49606 stop:49923 length:318 start_codon:yes stop_codon:yes gene_type:complete
MVRVITVLSTLLFIFASLSWAQIPHVYGKCISCHGIPGKGNTKIAPDLADSSYTLEQMKMQVYKGSNWQNKPREKMRYRKKKMPAITKINDEEIEAIYKYVRSKN